MALTQTTLAAAIGAGDLLVTFNAPSVGSLPPVGTVTPNWPIKIDSEVCFLTQMISSLSGKLRARGSEGTYAVSHDILASVMTSATVGDFPSPASPILADNAPTVDNIVNIGQDQTIAVPTLSTTYYINKASVCNITLVNGLPTQAGVVMTFIAMSGFGHVITYAPGFTVGANTKATFTSNGGTCVIEVTNTGTLVCNSTQSCTLSA